MQGQPWRLSPLIWKIFIIPPKKELLQCIQDSTDRYGSLSFQDDSGIPEDRFLAMLELYLSSTFIEWGGYLYLQKRGICIGSCLAPTLSDLFLAHAGRTLSDLLEGSGVEKLLRFVADFLILVDKTSFDSDVVVSNTLTTFKHILSSIRFLDLNCFYQLTTSVGSISLGQISHCSPSTPAILSLSNVASPVCARWMSLRSHALIGQGIVSLGRSTV